MSRLALQDDAYRLLFENHPLPMWICDAQTDRFLAVNKAAIAHYGYTREEFESMTIRDVQTPADIAAPRQHASAAVPGTNFGGTWRHIKKDRSVIVAETTSTGMEYSGRRAVLILVHDVTERKHYEEALAEANQQLHALIQGAPLAIIAQDASGRIRLWNPAAEAMLGWTAAEALGKVLPLTVSDSRRDPLATAKPTPAAGAPALTEIERIRKDGTRITLNTCSLPLTDAKGQFGGHVSFSIDLSERKQLEQILRQTTKMEAVGRLAGGVAHDFNNLITIILGYCNLAIDQLHPSDALYQNLEGIRKAADRATLLTRQMLAFSRKQVLQPKILDLNEIVADTSRLLRRLIGEHIDLQTTMDPNVSRIQADPGQIEQILLNLTVNARDAMPDGGKILIETRNVDLDENYARTHLSTPAGEFVLLSVTDTGVGMDAETQSHIFEPFFTTKPPDKGTGLGLATVYGIVKQSGGNIWVYSEPGHGTTFKIYLPAVQSGEPPDEMVPTDTTSLKGTETILLVEDEAELRTLTREILENNGYHVLEAVNGEDGLFVAANYSGPIQLMITDVVMPLLGGRELARRLAEVRPRTKVIFISGYASDAVVQHGVLDSGAVYLEKPYTGESLARKVRDVLRGNGRR